MAATANPTATAQAAARPTHYAPSRADCSVVTVYAAGQPAGRICEDEAAAAGLTVLDLSDEWTPTIFARDRATGDTPYYRSTYIRLANSRVSDDLGVYGITPSLSVLAARLADDRRHTCHAKVDAGALEAFGNSPEPAANAPESEKKPPTGAIAAAQARLACDGFLGKLYPKGRIDAATTVALDRFRRRHMIVAVGGLDRETARALALSNEEREFRAFLRGLRERVVTAAGLIEDGSALGRRAKVAGRDLDAMAFRALDNVDPLEGGAEDLIGAATDAAASALGFTDFEPTRAFIASYGSAGLGALKVAVALPKAPNYHSSAMELRVEIERGDVFYDTPWRAAAERKKRGAIRRPTFVLFAKDNDRERPLLRWGTTIGGWQKERKEDGEIALAYKESDVGDRIWRHLIASPAWMPPDSTPEADLLRKSTDGSFSLKRDLIQPGYRNAYGLMMLIHHAEVERNGKKEYLDHGIRTHGSVNYKSIMRGESHGCHRLFNHLTVRLGGFLLAHRNVIRRGKLHGSYQRTLNYEGQTIEVEVPTRGYLYELDPPVPVRVLEGRIAGEAQKPISKMLSIPSDSAG